MTDTWLDQPFGEGVVLIGDAGWSDPVIGQGLSVACRDAHVLSNAVFFYGSVDGGDPHMYAEERRARSVRFTVRVINLINHFGDELVPIALL